MSRSDFRLRCKACGNLTRFDVLERRRTRSYYHFSLGGELTVEEVEELEREFERITCRWCQASGGFEEFAFEGAQSPPEDFEPGKAGTE